MTLFGRLGPCGVFVIMAVAAWGQEPSEETKSPFGILPNFRSVEPNTPFEPLSVRRKFTIGFRDSTAYPIFGYTAVVAGWSQLINTHPYYGQGMEGYGKRFASAYGDVAIGNMMTESVMPSLLHQDPRYFRKGTGSFMSRLGYSASRTFVTRNDSGKNGFNYSEFAGSAITAGIGNIYYRHERTTGDNFERFTTTVVSDLLSQLLNEFLPDINRKLFSKKNKSGASH